MIPPADKLESATREEIDQHLIAAGWVVQQAKEINLTASLGVAVREDRTSTGPVDYALYIEARLCGVLETKREGANLGGAAEQSARYAVSDFEFAQRRTAADRPLPFLYEATNNEIRFRDVRDPKPRSRNLFHFHKPETLHNWLQQEDTLRGRLRQLPGLTTENLWDCQVKAINGIEQSLKAANPRTLLQMATGTGKTYTAVTAVYRLAKFAKAGRVLFLVDRANLGRQALKEFTQYTVPGDGRKFTDLYNVHQLGTAGIPDATKVTIATIQRLYSQLTGKALDEDADERSAYETEAITNKQQRPVEYNPDLPIETFDFIIIDECHRSIYNLWRQVLEYFDAFLIGLTATPTKKTIGYFHQNLVSEYSHEAAVVDRVNVGYDIYRIKTRQTEQGGLIEAGTAIEIRDRLTKARRWEVLDQDEDYAGTDLDRSVISDNQLRTVITAFKDKALSECFPGRGWVPKTLIFAKNDAHADRIVDIVRESFAEDNNFCKKITYRIGKRTAEDTITEFRTGPGLRIAVTVDMVATGTDIKPLECIIFMRDVKSQAYYEQMKGRGTRVIDRDELHKVTPDAPGKTRFVLIDAVGVTETDKTQTHSLERKPSIPTDKLMLQIARGDRHPDTLRTLGNRLLRLDIKLDDRQRRRINDLVRSLGKEGTTEPNPLPLGEGLGEGEGEGSGAGTTGLSPLPLGEGLGEGEGSGEGVSESTPLPLGEDLGEGAGAGTTGLSPLPLGEGLGEGEGEGATKSTPLPLGEGLGEGEGEGVSESTPLPLGEDLGEGVGEGSGEGTTGLSSLPPGEGSGEGEGEGVSEIHEPTPEYLIENARELRKNQTDAESLLWQLLRNRRIENTKFRRQHPISPYILDFYCHDKKLAIELDGGQHNTDEGRENDRKRTEFLQSNGIRVLRFWNNDVLQNTEAVLEQIYNALIPHPSPEGRRVPSPLSPGEGLGEGASEPTPLPLGEDLGEGEDGGTTESSPLPLGEGLGEGEGSGKGATEPTPLPSGEDSGEGEGSGEGASESTPLPLGEELGEGEGAGAGTTESSPLPLGEGLGEGEDSGEGEGAGEDLLPQTTLGTVAANLIHATNEDNIHERISAAKGLDTGTAEAQEYDRRTWNEVYIPLADAAVKPFHTPELRELINELRRNSEQLVDDSADELTGAGYDKEKAESLINNWRQFIKDHKDELDAIQLIYQQPYKKRHLSYDMINQLVEAIEQPPYHIAPVEVWKAYEQLQQVRVKGAPPETKLAVLVSLIRLATGATGVLESFTDLVNNRFENWLKQQNQITPLPSGEGLGEGTTGLSPLPLGEDLGEGMGEGLGAGEGTTGLSPLPLGEDLGEGVGEGLGEGVGEDLGEGVGEGSGEGVGEDLGEGAGAGGFTPEQLAWLNKIKDQIAQNAEMTVDDFDYIPFNQDGGLLKARELFGNGLEDLIETLNCELIA